MTDTTHDIVPSPSAFDQARAVADAILYEGYLLYPYRKSSGKNRVRWQFGVLAPRAWIAATGPEDASVAGSVESWFQQTECLMEAPEGAVVSLRLRFLQLQQKAVAQRTQTGEFDVVETLDVDGETHVGFDEAVPREFDLTAAVAELLDDERTFLVEVDGGEDVEPIVDERGHEVGRVSRRRRPISAAVQLSAVVAPAPFRLLRLRVRVENSASWVDAGALRDEALRSALIASHTLIGVDGGDFLSLLEPPEWAAAAARRCSNIHTFPVLTGDAGRRGVLLSSPILLYDYPRIAPESAGDLHDATEIDEILSLRTLTLTEAEKREARATDPRAAAIVDRVDTMPPEIFQRLHGAIRSLRPVTDGADGVPGSDDAETPWWAPGADENVDPQTDSVLVDGVRISRGSRVRLRPRAGGTDAHDMFLAGRTAHVEAVLVDVEGPRHVAVTLEDDPGAEVLRWYGRFFHFTAEELEPLEPLDALEDCDGGEVEAT